MAVVDRRLVGLSVRLPAGKRSDRAAGCHVGVSAVFGPASEKMEIKAPHIQMHHHHWHYECQCVTIYGLAGAITITGIPQAS